MSESINDTETEYASVGDPLNMHRTASNETTLVAEIPNIINEENIIIAPGQGKKTTILNYEFCEEQVFHYLLPKGKSGYNAPAGYFNQRLLNFNQMHIIYFLPGLCMSSTTYIHQ